MFSTDSSVRYTPDVPSVHASIVFGWFGSGVARESLDLSSALVAMQGDSPPAHAGAPSVESYCANAGSSGVIVILYSCPGMSAIIFVHPPFIVQVSFFPAPVHSLCAGAHSFAVKFHSAHLYSALPAAVNDSVISVKFSSVGSIAKLSLDLKGVILLDRFCSIQRILSGDLSSWPIIIISVIGPARNALPAFSCQSLYSSAYSSSALVFSLPSIDLFSSAPVFSE